MPISERDKDIKALVNFKDLNEKVKKENIDKQFKKSVPIYIDKPPEIKQDKPATGFNFGSGTSATGTGASQP